MRAPRCACGCGLPTAGGQFRAGHATRRGRHWAYMPSREKALLGSVQWRRDLAYQMWRSGQRDHDFTDAYFALFEVVRGVRSDAELEVIIKADTYRAVDIGIPVLLLGFELDGGNRYRVATAHGSNRDQALLAVGWSLVHCREVPTAREVEEIVRQRAMVAGGRAGQG